MAKYIFFRLLHGIPVLLGISLIAFLLGIVMPGDPAEIALSAHGTYTPSAEQLEIQRRKMGLDKPYAFQYIRWLQGAVSGDLGTSYRTKEKVSQEIFSRLPLTVKLTAFSMVLTLLLGIPMGIAMALFRNRFFDILHQFLSILYVSIPGFWLALIGISIFAEQLKWLPTSGQGSLRHLILPAIVLSVSTIGSTARLVRSSVLKELSAAYVVAADSKGISKSRIYIAHAFRNSLIPVIALLGSHIGGILGGSIIVETIFALNGMGKFAIDSIAVRDYPALQGYVLITGFVFVMMNLLVDMGYYLCNPRVRLGGAAS